MKQRKLSFLLISILLVLVLLFGAACTTAPTAVNPDEDGSTTDTQSGDEAAADDNQTDDESDSDQESDDDEDDQGDDNDGDRDNDRDNGGRGKGNSGQGKGKGNNNNRGNDQDDDDDASVCERGSDNPHPQGTRIAAAYDADYAEVMAWHCEDNYGFGQIRRAYELAASDDISVEEAFAQLPADDEDDDDQDQDDDDDDAAACTGDQAHPQGTRLSAAFDAEYDEIMAWHCDSGFGFGVIKQVYELAEETGTTPDALFTRLEAGESLGDLKNEARGKPADGDDDDDDDQDQDDDDQ